MGRAGRWIAVVMVLAVCATSDVHAQACSTNNTIAAVTQSCNVQLHDALALQPAVGVALAAGNPVAGASSTLGMRIGSVPRLSLAGRVSAGRARTVNAGTIASLNFDAAVGIFSGFRLLPTIGGFGSLDAVFSAGKAHVPDRISDDDPSSWAVGGRLGLLRESFTAPGVSITGMYRRIGDVSRSANNGAMYALTDNSVTTFRAIVGKRLFVLGAAAGIGYDRYKSDLDVTAIISQPGAGVSTFSEDDRTTTRLTIFGNVSWTMLILNIVAEGGWQEGGDAFSAPLPAGQEGKTDRSTGYGSLAIRLAL